MIAPYFDLVKWIGFLSILIYIPCVCYWDLRWRRVPLNVWIPILLVNVPALFYLYTGGLQWGYLIISILLTLIFLAIGFTGIIGGADMIFLLIIGWIAPLDPFDGDQAYFQAKLMVWVLCCLALTALCIFCYNVAKGHKYDSIDMFERVPRNVPMMIPIAAAYLLALWV